MPIFLVFPVFVSFTHYKLFDCQIKPLCYISNSYGDTLKIRRDSV